MKRLLLLSLALLCAAIPFFAQTPSSPWFTVTSLPTAASAVLGMPYRWTQATTANTCPSAGAGGSGGSAQAGCITLDGTSWTALGGAGLPITDNGTTLSTTRNFSIGTRVLSQTGDNLITPAFMIGQFSGSCSTPPCLLGSNGALYQPTQPISSSGLGYVTPFGFPASVSSSGTITTNRVYIWQFVAPLSITFTQLHFVLNGGGAGAVRFALLDSAKTFLASSTVNTGLFGSQDLLVTFSAQTLSVGQVYYVAFTSDNSGITLSCVSTAASFIAAFNATATRMGYCANASTGSGASLAMPASCGAVTALSVGPPAIIVEP